jgi:small subunit ribosomal protein S17
MSEGASSRGARKTRVGRVVNDKQVVRSKKYHAHDEEGVAQAGDVVRIVETRPLSKLKRWRVVEVVEQAR